MTIDKLHQGVEQTQQDAENSTAWQGEHPLFVNAADHDKSKTKDHDPAHLKKRHKRGHKIKDEYEHLKTGDRLMKVDDAQVLMTPGGEEFDFAVGYPLQSPLVAFKDGGVVQPEYRATELTEPPIEISTFPNGLKLEMGQDVGRLIYPNNDTVEFDRDGICSITRDSVKVEFHKPTIDPIEPLVPPDKKYPI
ncbi:MAG TPA: hypothetical protein V6C81_00295 [Planktothrix sp.]|jgi:hypothetical protein